jgi:hypothetical protein
MYKLLWRNISIRILKNKPQSTQLVESEKLQVKSPAGTEYW